MRKICFYLPNIFIDSNIVLDNFRLIRASDFEFSKEIISDEIFGDLQGTLIEVRDFHSGDTWCSYIKIEIYRALELIKFSYFFQSISNIINFASNDSFDLFVIVEKHEDPSVEQKICFSNGVDDYLLSLDKYYNYKSKYGEFSRVHINECDLRYYKTINSLPLSNDDLLLISIFNKTRNLYTTHDFIDRVLFARISIEGIAKKLNWNLKTVSESFLNKAVAVVEKKALFDNRLKSFYQNHVCSKREEILSTINSFLDDLRGARHELAHAAKQDKNYVNIGYYMAWFPIVFMLSFGEDDVTEDLAVRIMFFLAASSVDASRWQQREYTSTSTKRDLLETYEYTSTVIPMHIKSNNDTYIEATMKGMINSLLDK